MSCPGFQGNQDFYGLGTRVGIYLQWFSAYISNTLDSDSAAANHDANTVFLLALLIALAVAMGDGSLRLAEAYLMLLLASGFAFTSLSFLGFRLHLLRPGRVALFRASHQRAMLPGHVHNEEHALQASSTTTLARITGFSSGVQRYSFGAASDFKHPAFFWGGVAARVWVGVFTAILNLRLWFDKSIELLADDECGKRVNFLGDREISGSVLLFFKVASIMLCIPVFYLGLAMQALNAQLFQLSYAWIIRGWMFRSPLQDRMGWRTFLDVPARKELARIMGKFAPSSVFTDVEFWGSRNTSAFQ